MKIAKINKYPTILLLAFSVVFFLTRVPRLHNDTINPDAVNWHYRSQQFINGLKYRQWEKTYQHYHPGVTLMWVTGVPVEIFKHIVDTKNYDIYNFQAFDFISKFSLVFVQLVLTLYTIFLLRKYFGLAGAVAFASIFSFEPFFIGNSRLYHLDVLLSLFLFAGLLTGFLAYERKSWVYYAATGSLLALAFLTKSIGILGVVFYAFWLLFKVIKAKDFKWLFTVVAAYVVTLFVFFPALWVRPIYYISQIFLESQRIGLRRGHEQVVLGEQTDVAAWYFYLLVFVVRTSPVLILGLLSYVFYYYKLSAKYIKQINRGLVTYMVIFSLIYLCSISLASKKIDRYLIVLYPFISVLTFYGFLALSKLKNFYMLLMALIVGFVVYPVYKTYPYYFVYSNPLIGPTESANGLVGFKPFGVGIYDLKDYIGNRYAKEFARRLAGNPRLGFIDVKPMEAIYPSSKVFDIRETDPSNYDLLVLGINEAFPGKVTNSGYKFVKSGSLYINGLEYWKIYEKGK